MSARFQISTAESVKLIVKTCLEEGVTDHGQIAHVLGQCEHETHFIYAEEINGPAQARRLGYNGGANYYGRGYIQITHIDNYRKFGRIFGQDFAGNPALVKEPTVAAKIAVVGCRDGLFRRGHDLARYCKNGTNDFYNARRIVNGFVAAQAKSVRDKSNKWLAQVPNLINGAEPDLSATPTNTGAGISTSATDLGGPISAGSNTTGAGIGVCSELFPVRFTLEEALFYPGCFSRDIGNAMGGTNNLNYPANGMGINGATNFNISDFDPTVPICNGCLGFPFKKDIKVTSPFCQRRTSKSSGNIYYHSGTDYGGPQGEEVIAVADGTVISPLIAGDGYQPGFVDIQHEKLGGLVSRSAHIIPSVRPGDKVKQGDVIGKVGPYPSGGPHLHLELRKDKGAGGSAFSIEECKTKFLDPALFCRRT